MTESMVLHLGIGICDLYTARRRLRGAPLIDGDGWGAWGEPVGSAGNDGVTLHVVVEATGSEADRIVTDLSDALTPMRGSTVVAVETQAHDWSVAETGGRIWHRIDRVDGSSMLVVEIVEAPLQTTT